MYILKGINLLIEAEAKGSDLYIGITGENSHTATFELEEATRFETREEAEKQWARRLEGAFESYEIIEEEVEQQ